MYNPYVFKFLTCGEGDFIKRVTFAAVLGFYASQVFVLQAGEEIVWCADKKGGDPAIFRKGDCQTLDDPTVPPGFVSKSGGSQESSGSTAMPQVGADKSKQKSPAREEQQSTDVEQLKKEFDEVKKKLAEIQDVGRHEINASKGEEVEALGTPGPWRVSETLVPAVGEKGGDLDKSAMINGYRYRLGERVDGGVVKEIARDRVVMLHDGKETVVPFDKTTHASVFGRVGAVPLTRDSFGIYTVKVRLNNNQEIDAVVDTGASIFVVPEDVVAWLMRSGTLKSEDFLSEGKAILGDGSSIDTRIFKIHSLRIGDMELKDVEGAQVSSKKGEKDQKKEETDASTNKDNKTPEPPKSVKPKEVTGLTQPLFGVNGLRMLGKWRIDHINNQLIVER